MSLAPTAANLAWAATNLPAWAAFRRALANPRITQQTVLAKIIHSARRSEFGRRHGFDGIRAAADFAERVPIRDYSDFEPWIDRIRNGEPNILTADPVKRLAVTAGTSSARKLIPYTKGLQAEFNRAIGPWIVDLFRSHPKTIGGAAYWSISPVAQHDTEPPKVPIGFEEDSEYLGGIRRHLVDAVMAVPSSVRHASTIEEWRSETIRHLSSRRDLRLISIWHPSFLELLLDHLPASPSELWPNLSLVSCWGDGHSSLAMRALQDRLDPVAFQPKGLIATEGIVSIPFAGRWPLAVRSHYLEFLATDGSVVAAHELREGQTYEMLITTSGGLYRYRLNDLIRVEGRSPPLPRSVFWARPVTFAISAGRN
jgi:hypothetical protein